MSHCIISADWYKSIGGNILCNCCFLLHRSQTDKCFQREVEIFGERRIQKRTGHRIGVVLSKYGLPHED